MKENGTKKLLCKALGMALACCVALPFAVGCKPKQGHVNTTTPTDNGTDTGNRSFVEQIGLPERDLGGEEFVIRYHTGGTLGPEPLNVALEDANDLSLERYKADEAFKELTGAAIVYQPAATDPNTANTEVPALRALKVSGDLANIDFLMVGMRAVGTLVNENFFLDLVDYNHYIRTGEKYYNVNMTADLTLGGKSFVASGYYTYKNIFFTQVTHVNNDILSSLYSSNDKIEELYGLALDHAWTMELLLECGKDYATGKVNDDPTQDKYTYLISRNGADGLFFSGGGLSVTKDEQDLPTLVLDRAANVDLLNYLQETLGKNAAVRFTPDDKEVDEFSKKQALFLNQGIGYVKEVKDKTGMDIRILPPPLRTADTDYHAYLGAWCGNVAGIPGDVADPDLAAYCYELYMALSYKYMYPIIYETQFGIQYVANATESRIFDLVVESGTYDIAEVYRWTYEHNPRYRDIVYNEQPVGSGVKNIADHIQAGIATFLENYAF